MSPNTLRSALRGAAALTVAALATLGLAMPASAATGPGNIDPDETVSLTVHKYVQPDGELGENDGHVIDPADMPAGAQALEGVEFTIQRVTSVDLLTNAGWELAQDLDASSIPADALGAEISGTTGADGSVTFGDDQVEIGLYLVRETGSGDNPIVQPAIPFLVALPQADGDGAWNYDVHVYPKNALSSVTKAVDDSDAVVLGDTVDWTITSAVPLLPEGTHYTDYAISDSLDERLGYQELAVSLVDGGTTALEAGTHYELTAPAAGETGEVVVAFTPAGLALLDGAGASAQVVIDLSTTVLSLGDGVIPNTATVFINDPDRTNGNDSNEVDTKWGALRILKYAEGDESRTLEGAVFSVYAVDPSTSTDASPVVEGLTTDAAGDAVTVLQTGQSDTRTYWVVETEAPAGYELSDEPIAVEVTAGAVADAVVVKVANAQTPAFHLPLTGGSGTAGLVIVGLAMVLVGVVALTVRSRRRASASIGA
ncbi:SpaH/EbpB family LPXTG-anchored major pilin [Microbacterium indicum]|uniref:SpaH/EbpB family LPXTG-anchored major pilin n=1 Tax=Microbacterium indicum TaxID=358100 RepID=UPI00041304DB|nr:SpaH/EbpB family LPXTG-anchored major pilin [Microbacterium indicum]